MKAWTMISNEAYFKLRENGRLVCDSQELTMLSDGGKHVEDAYYFMIDTMNKYGLKKPDDAEFPIWCYTAIDGQRGAKPDESQLNSDGGYLLSIELNPDDILESNLAVWDAVISGLNLHDLEMDESIVRSLSGKEKGWESLFDLSARIKDINDGYDDNYPTYQAVFWELKLVDVRSVEQILEWDFSE